MYKRLFSWTLPLQLIIWYNAYQTYLYYTPSHFKPKTFISSIQTQHKQTPPKRSFLWRYGNSSIHGWLNGRNDSSISPTFFKLPLLHISLLLPEICTSGPSYHFPFQKSRVINKQQSTNIKFPPSVEVAFTLIDISSHLCWCDVSE